MAQARIVGDGINDAPYSLAPTSESPCARLARRGDRSRRRVLMTDEPSKLVSAIRKRADQDDRMAELVFALAKKKKKKKSAILSWALGDSDHLELVRLRRVAV
jgi:hypothetical protein